MATLTGHRARRAGSGFTLIELLLAVALVLLLAGAMIFSFSTLGRGTQLEEGALRLESLMRFASAQAANSGRRVQLVFEEDADSALEWPVATVRVMWEPDPLGQPGRFEPLTEAAAHAEAVNELVWIEFSTLVENPGDAAATPRAESDEAGDEASPQFFAPVMFYPDGSSDSANVTLSSRSPEDTQWMSVRLTGLTGSIKRERLVDETEDAGDGEAAPADAEAAP